MNFRNRAVKWAAWMLLLLGGMTLASSAIPFGLVRSRLDGLARDGSAEPYTPELHRRLQLAAAISGGGMMVAAGGVWFRMGRGSWALSQTPPRRRRPATWRVIWRWLRPDAAWLAGVTLLALLVRLPFLTQPVRYDEAHTWLEYASQPWFVGIAKYNDPNNHVLHTLLVHGVTRIAGDSLPAIRLTALTAGVLLAPATALLARRLAGRLAGAIAGVFVASSSPLIEYSTLARGYTLLCLFTVALCLAAVSIRRHRRAWMWLAVLGALGMWTIPVMAYPLVIAFAWLLLETPSAPRRGYSKKNWLLHIAATMAATGVLTALLYTPVMLVGGPQALLPGAAAPVQDIPKYLSSIPHQAAEAIQLLLRDAPWFAQLALLAGLFAAWAAATPAERSRYRNAILAFVICLAVVLAQRVAPYPRVWLFLFPLIGAIAATGLSRVVLVWRRPATRALAGLVLFATIGFASLLAQWRSDSIARSRETGVMPEARQVVQFLKTTLDPQAPIIAVAPTSAPLVFYAQREDLSLHHFDPPGLGSLRTERAVVVVTKTEPQTVVSVLEQLDLAGLLPTEQFEIWRDFPTARLYRLSAISEAK
jgi:hypothetical protein